MATAVRSNRSEKQATPTSREQALCTIFDIFEEALEELEPEQRKAALDGISATAEKLRKRA